MIKLPTTNCQKLEKKKQEFSIMSCWCAYPRKMHKCDPVAIRWAISNLNRLEQLKVYPLHWHTVHISLPTIIYEHINIMLSINCVLKVYYVTTCIKSVNPNNLATLSLNRCRNTLDFKYHLKLILVFVSGCHINCTHSTTTAVFNIQWRIAYPPDQLKKTF